MTETATLSVLDWHVTLGVRRDGTTYEISHGGWVNTLQPNDPDIDGACNTGYLKNCIVTEAVYRAINTVKPCLRLVTP